ncbi:MAG: LPS assembly lipoprotein LptE [Pseudobacter sp.]|uniref:LPS assembly lipoprotein LptE n=1 Tax=Pseudobacter sp. TaxID=2045420 RepID=UPI003F7FBA0E
MISKSNRTLYRSVQLSLLAAGLLLVALFSGCYSFKDVSIPPEVKTARVNYIENKARYINPQLSPQLTEKLRQKINNQTRLTLVQNDDAHYDISGYVSDYSITTSGISQQGNQQQASMNRLTVTVTLIFKNNLDPTKNFEAPISRNFEFSANISLQQAEAQLSETIIQNLTDEIFNRIFSNW